MTSQGHGFAAEVSEKSRIILLQLSLPNYEEYNLDNPKKDDKYTKESYETIPEIYFKSYLLKTDLLVH